MSLWQAHSFHNCADPLPPCTVWWRSADHYGWLKTRKWSRAAFSKADMASETWNMMFAFQSWRQESHFKIKPLSLFKPAENPTWRRPYRFMARLKTSDLVWKIQLYEVNSYKNGWKNALALWEPWQCTFKVRNIQQVRIFEVRKIGRGLYVTSQLLFGLWLVPCSFNHCAAAELTVLVVAQSCVLGTDTRSACNFRRKPMLCVPGLKIQGADVLYAAWIRIRKR